MKLKKNCSVYIRVVWNTMSNHLSHHRPQFWFQVITQGNSTKSELTFVPTTDDDEKQITCRAENPVVAGQFLESHWKINVICKYRPPTILYLVQNSLIIFFRSPSFYCHHFCRRGSRNVLIN